MAKLQMSRSDNLELARVKRLLEEAEGPDDRTRAYLCLGVLDEHREEWDGAIANYRRCLAAGSRHTFLLYFGNNNLGYSLVQLGRFDEAEEFCLAAIEIEPSRYNAHKNLGLVRQGQRRWQDAANSYLAAYRLCPENVRAWHLLWALLSLHPELLTQSADLRNRVTLLGVGPDTAAAN